MQPFFRITQIQVPVSPVSAATPFPCASLLPAIPDRAFMFWNPNPFDCNLEGIMPAADGSAGAFTPVTALSGWPIPARTLMGPFTSKNPAYYTAGAFPTVEQAQQLGTSFDYTGRVLWLIYGQGT